MKKRTYKILCALLCFLCIFLLLSGCVDPAGSEGANNKIKIVCTIFPQYDFCRNIVGDYADVILLMDRAGDLHSYEPSAQDMMQLSDCDLFIGVGGASDQWVDAALKASENSAVTRIDMMDHCVLLKENDGNILQQHDHPQQDHHDDEYDEHVWTSLKNAKQIVAALAEAISLADEEHRTVYEQNASTYITELELLDAQYEETFHQVQNRFVVFADRFPFLYLMNDYGLTWCAAFSGCSGESEATFQTMVALTETVLEKNLPAVFVIEYSDEALADAVCRVTGAEKKMLYSCQCITSTELKNGVSYLEKMRENLTVLKEVLEG